MPSPGEIVAGGMDKLAEGFQTYQANQQTDAVMRGMLNQLVSQGGPQALTQLSPNGQALAQKFMEGKANRSDMMQLMGEASASHTLLQQQQAAALNSSNIGLNNATASRLTSEGQLNAAQASLLNLKLNRLRNPGQYFAQPDALGTPSANAVSNYAQPVGGTGAPPNNGPTSQVQALPPKHVSITDPQIQAMYPKVYSMTFGDDDKTTEILQQQVDSINKQMDDNYTKQAGVTKPTGNLYFKRLDYKDGVPQTDVYSPEISVGGGTLAQSLQAGNQEISVPHGQKPPGPVVKWGDNEPDDSANVAGYNPNDPGWQSEVADAYNKAGSSAVALGNAKALQDAATAYTSGNMSQFNAIRGDPKYAKIFSVFSGTNPAAAFKIALAANTSSVLNEIRGPNGSVGGRILQNEYDNTSKVLADATMDNNSILAAAKNNYTLADRRNNIDQAVAKLRETMPLGDATAQATKMFGLSAPNIQTGLSPAGQASAQVSQPPPPGMVRMRNKAGATGLIPQANVQAATAAGFTPAQ